MKNDLSAWYGEVSKALDAHASPLDGMQALLAYCNRQDPWKGWAILAELDFDSDVADLERWLERVLKQEPPPNSVKAFWFGIFNPVYDGETVCDCYIAGSSEFDPHDESFEWACDPGYFPNGRYAHSKILRSIDHSLNTSPNPAMGKYVSCLGYTAFAVRELARRIDKRLWLGQAEQRGLAVGFDSGDGVLLEAVHR